jgi:hypothetical protein
MQGAGGVQGATFSTGIPSQANLTIWASYILSTGLCEQGAQLAPVVAAAGGRNDFGKG